MSVLPWVYEIIQSDRPNLTGNTLLDRSCFRLTFFKVKVEAMFLGLTLKLGHLGLRLIVLALTIGWFSFMCYIITR